MKLFKHLLSFFPSALPSGLAEFHKWADEVIHLAGAPNNDSVKFAVATMILHADSTAAFKPKHFFVKSLKKSMANQVAAGLMQDLKQKQQEAIAAEQAKAVENTVTNASQQ